MKYSVANEVSKVGVVSVMRSDSTNKKNCFISLEEIPMTEELAGKVAEVVDLEFRNAKLRG